MQEHPYDRFAETYELWTKTAPITALNLPYYVDAYVDAEEPVVELGIGNGRIAIEAARRGRRVIGVDASNGMLERCRERAAQAGVLDLLTLIHADIRDFTLSEPAQLIALPFHSIGHLTTTAELDCGLANVRAQLAPGGRFLCDHFIPDPSYARLAPVRRLRATGRDRDGRRILLWTANESEGGPEARLMTIWASVETLGDDGRVEETRYHTLELAWYTVAELSAAFERAELEIETVYGDFDRNPLADDSGEQVWVTRRPE